MTSDPILHRLVIRGLTYHWRTNLAVVAGVATAVAVLAGALLVGDSVRGSLRDLVLHRLGRTDHLVVSTGFFREQLASDLEANPAFASAFTGVAPLVVVQGFVSDQESGRRASQVRVYGVDDRFWRFHGVTAVTGPGGLDAMLSPALAEEIRGRVGGTILIRVQRPLDIPLESVHGRKDDVGQTLRLDVRQIVAPESLGDFALDAQQGDVRAVFVPIAVLQEELERAGRVNALLVSARPESAAAAQEVLPRVVRDEVELADVGLRLRALSTGGISVESDAGLLTDEQVQAAQAALTAAGADTTPVFTYLANTLRIGNREIPYSLVTAMDVPRRDASDGIVLTEWAGTELGAKPGDMLTLEYYVWEEPGQLVTRSTELRVERIVPTDFGDRDLAPVLPGITNSPTLSDWDPPFPVDLRRVRPVDEQVLGAVSHHAESVRQPCHGAAAVALALRRGDVDSHRRGCARDGKRRPSCDGTKSRYARRSTRSRWAWRSCRFAPTPSPRRGAPPISARTSSISASSWWCRRCCSHRCSSSSGWSSARARSACFAPWDSVRAMCGGCSWPRGSSWPWQAAPSASPARSHTRLC